jgi:hypothetical protein
MPYKVSMIEQDDHIRVEMSGERITGNEEADSVSAWSGVADVCREKKIDRILAVSKVTGRLPARAAHAIAYNPERFGWSKNFKLAYVALSEESRQDSLFAEDVAVSSGFQVRVFDSEDKAKAWLLGN